METNKDLELAKLEVDLKYLKDEERKLRNIISYPDAKPEYVEGAKQNLSVCLQKIAETIQGMNDLKRPK
jgi:hypothetical protein